MTKHKIVFIVFDGLGDRPIPELNGLTPLEAAATPNLNALAILGINGLIHTIERSIRPGSDVAHLSLFGYDPRKYYRGRGVFEAAGLDMELHKGDVAFRGNVGTLNNDGIITDRRAGRIDNVEFVARAIDGMEFEDVKVMAKAGVGHRIVVVLRGPHLSDKVSDTDPHHDNAGFLESHALNNSEAAKKTANIVNSFTQLANDLIKDLLENKEREKQGMLPANCLLLRGAGEVSHFSDFKEQYGLTACCIAGGGLYKGIAKIIGMDIINVDSATGKPNTDARAKIKAFEDNYDKYDFFFIHFKGADTCAEDGKPVAKKEYIEMVDRELKPLIQLVKDQKIVVVVTGDHTTSSRLKAHTADEVPTLVAGLDVRVDGVDKFGERPAQNGGLGHMDGRHLMRFLVNLIGDEPLYGN